MCLYALCRHFKVEELVVMDSHLVLLINLPDNLINHELLFEELLVRLLSLVLPLHQLLLKLSLILRQLLVAFLLQLLLLSGCSLMVALHLTSKVCLLALMSERKDMHIISILKSHKVKSSLLGGMRTFLV